MKREFLVFAIALLTQSAYSQIIDDNLLLNYPFNGNSNDVSGNGFDAVGNATLVEDRFGNPGEAYYFNGNDSYLDLPNDEALKPNYPISLSLWVNYEDLNQENSFVFCTDFAQDNHTGVWIALTNDAKVALAIGDNTGNTSPANRRTKIGETSILPNTWYHLAFVVNSKDDMEIYIDCINDGGTYVGTGGELAYSDEPGSLGRKDSGVGFQPDYFKGAIDDFMYWDRALVATDIDTLCNNILSVGSNGEDLPSLILYPNPSSDELLIDGLTIEGSTQYSIIDARGRLIQKNELTDLSINISELQTGVYYLKIETASLSTVSKFIKE